MWTRCPAAGAIAASFSAAASAPSGDAEASTAWMWWWTATMWLGSRFITDSSVATISSVPASGVPSWWCHRPQGCRFMLDSANRVAASKSLEKSVLPRAWRRDKPQPPAYGPPWDRLENAAPWLECKLARRAKHGRKGQRLSGWLGVPSRSGHRWQDRCRLVLRLRQRPAWDQDLPRAETNVLPRHLVKGMDQAQSLIKELLCLRVTGGHGMVQVSQPRHHSCRLGRRRSRMTLRRDQDAQQHYEHNAEPAFHG